MRTDRAAVNWISGGIYSGIQVAISRLTAGVATLVAMSERGPAAPSWKPLYVVETRPPRRAATAASGRLDPRPNAWSIG